MPSLLTKSLEHSSIHYFCFCSVKFAHFIIIIIIIIINELDLLWKVWTQESFELDLTTSNEYSGRVASFNAMWQGRYIYAFEFLLILRAWKIQKVDQPKV